ncbi:methyltransferase domain-containing protein [Flavobacterium cellulosilyticum]|uniref:Methyltransferase domain-containing protein n=1 Tax=Flavobacterium cellulosilyticum TaxID=2541731 RepID=A0A4R5CEX1_9FLAO|nr:methyltransferase domain-containing protein [Flavobacterium cellulosilyticum]TDD95764.1 methyltransferase domain-containing protein [Flavobacterium cellulosilyticum]
MSSSKSFLTTDGKVLNQEFWDHLYKVHDTGWDVGRVSPPLKEYIDTLINKDISILIPGCGNSYEAEYLMQLGFTNVTIIDIAPTLVEHLREKFKENANVKIMEGDFFDHEGKYDLILEQTFFCALPPIMRIQYALKVHQLLKENGILAGLLFNKIFEDCPPFGGTQKEYEMLFGENFHILKMELCQNSIPKRANNELFVELLKKEN